MSAHDKCCIEGCARDVMSEISGLMVGGSGDGWLGCTIGEMKGLSIRQHRLVQPMGDLETLTAI
jgi:hypothetical protein